MQPFTKEEMTEYIDKRGYTADIESMWLYYEKTEFHYVQGRLRIPLKNWKADVNLKLRHGKFGAKKKPKPPEPKQPIDIEVISLEKRREIKAMADKVLKNPKYGFRSNKVFEQKRQKAIKKL